MLQYQCPKCQQVFATFKILCLHAEKCHAIGYLLRENLAAGTSFHVNSFGKDDITSLSDSPTLSRNWQEPSDTLSPNMFHASTRIISEIRDSFKRIRHLRNQVSFSPSVTFEELGENVATPNSKDQHVITSNNGVDKTLPKEGTLSNSDSLCSTSIKYLDSLSESRSIVVNKQRTQPQHNQLLRQVLELVFFYIDNITLWKCRSVCKLWKQISEMPKYWIRLRITNCLIVPKFLETISNWSRNLTSLVFEEIDLKNPHKHRGALENELELILKQSNHKITSISVINCGNHLTERTLWLASCYCPLLEEFAYISSTNPANSEAIWSLGAGCRKLQTLIIPPVYPNQRPDRFSDHCLSTIGKCWSNLKILCIGGTAITLKGLLAIAQRCKVLEILEVDHMGEIEESAVPPLCQAGLTNLRSIYFTHTPVSPQAIIQFKYFCKRLNKIKVVVCPEDYFIQPEFPDNRIDYAEKMISLQNLKRYSSMDEVLTIIDLNQF